jgi:outer membrane receptor for ferric coprogen and ferric-rhodotorulic acid
VQIAPAPALPITLRWTLGGGVFHQSERFTDLLNDTVLPIYTPVDSSAGVVLQPWTLQLNLKTAANHHLFESSNSTAVIFPTAPRNLQLTLGRCRLAMTGDASQRGASP